jgi:hypothetical protein
MIKQRKSILVLAVMVAFLGLGLFLPGLIGAGDLEPSVGPDDPGSAMYTLEDIYYYLDTGVAGTKRIGGFVEPTSPPGSTGYTLDDVHSMISAKCTTCTGTLNGTRWCDNQDGTVTDMTTGLVWLKDAAWGGTYAFWVNTVEGTNAHNRAALRGNNWRLPTIDELVGLVTGIEPVRSSTPRAFTGVQPYHYWSSTAYGTEDAFRVYMPAGTYYFISKHQQLWVWPVRSDN